MTLSLLQYDMTISPHLTLGTLNHLRIDRFAVPGLYAMAEDGKDVLLPNQYVTDEMMIDDILELFLYTDSEDRIVATTQRPLAMLGEFALFEVVDVTKFGAFVDWGLPKDLFVPRHAQKKPFHIGDKRVLHVSYDERTHRLIGEEKISKYLSNQPKGLKPHQAMEVLVMAKTPMGFKVIVNDRYEGMLYNNELFETLSIGDQRTAYLKALRRDGKLDLSLQPAGTQASDVATQKVLQLLEEGNGMLPYNYKSDPDLIGSIFGLSRKSFKRALTTLQEAGKIEVKENGIYRR
jgi:predicted RNA-binding protein (virulence factor B family)